MEKADVLLAALASGNVETYTPADVQRLLFLISWQIPGAIDSPPFKFTVCDYGPFDPRVYGLLEELELDAYVSVAPQAQRREITLTPAGRVRATEMLDQVSPDTVDYMRRASRFVVAKSTRVLIHMAGRADARSSRENRLRLSRNDRE